MVGADYVGASVTDGSIIWAGHSCQCDHAEYANDDDMFLGWHGSLTLQPPAGSSSLRTSGGVGRLCNMKPTLTCLVTLSLEVYYRYLPLSSPEWLKKGK